MLRVLRYFRMWITGIVNRSDDGFCLRIQSCDPVGTRVSEVRLFVRQDRVKTPSKNSMTTCAMKARPQV